MSIACDLCGKIFAGKLVVVSDYGDINGWLYCFCSEVQIGAIRIND